MMKAIYELGMDSRDKKKTNSTFVILTIQVAPSYLPYLPSYVPNLINCILKGVLKIPASFKNKSQLARFFLTMTRLLYLPNMLVPTYLTTYLFKKKC